MPGEAIVVAGGPLRWALLAIALAGASPPVLALLWVIWDRVRPLLIPQSEIDRVAAACIARYGERAFDILSIDADRAERRGDDQQTGCLLRIIRAVERMEDYPAGSDAGRPLLH